MKSVQKYKAAWREAIKSELDGHKTTGTYEAATPPRGWKPVGAKWMFSYTTDEDGLIVETKARPVTKDCSQVRDVDFFQTFAPTPSSASNKILAAVANEHGAKIFHLDVIFRPCSFATVSKISHPGRISSP